MGFLTGVRVRLQPGEDPFGEQRRDKKARLASQAGRQLKNKQASDKIHGQPVLPPTLKLAATLPEHGKGVPTKRRELKADVGRGFPVVPLSALLCEIGPPAKLHQHHVRECFD